MKKENLSFLILVLFLSFLPFHLSFAGTSKIILNEIMWGSDKDGEEWIELRNLTNSDIDLSGWSIENAKSANKVLVINSGIIPANGYFLICDNDSQKTNCDYYDAISLNNNYKDNGKLVLTDSNKNIVDQTPEPTGSSWPAGKSTGVSMQRLFENGQVKSEWQDNNLPTPQDSGIELEANAGPAIYTLTLKEVIFDGSSSKGNIQKYIWNFGDGNILEGKRVSYSYKFAGKYVVSLTVSDGKNKKEDITEVIVFPDSIFVSEISLKEKWIEIYNNSDFVEDISGWGLSNTKDITKFIFPEGSFIGPKSFIVLNEKLVGSLISSKGGTLYFFYPTGDIRFQLSYQNLSEAIARKGSDYFYTETETPGKENIISGNFLGIGGGVQGFTVSSPHQQEEKELAESQKGVEGENDTNNKDSEKIGMLPELREAKIPTSDSSEFLSKNLLSEAKNAKIPLVLGASGVILFSGTLGMGLVRLRKRLKSFQPNKEKIEVEIEK